MRPNLGRPPPPEIHSILQISQQRHARPRQTPYEGRLPPAPVREARELERGKICRMRIDAKHLAQWADSREAQAELPRLIRLLVWSGSATLQRVDFAAGESVALAGWDGTVEALTGDAFLPAGISGWELSADKGPGKKANRDYLKRTADPGDLCPAESTYVAVSLRRWAGRKKWENERQAEGIWKDVRAIDAVLLEQWIEQAPAVALWLQSLLGGRPPGLRSLSEEWLEYVLATEPPLTSEVLLCDRETAVTSLREWLSGPPSVREIEAETAEEVAAFVWAALHNFEDRWKARAIVLDHGESWAELAPRESGLLVILKAGSPGLPSRIQQAGSHVIVPVATRGVRSANRLKRPQAFQLSKSLEKSLGLAHGQAEGLANRSRGSLTALRRLIAASPPLARPAWAEPKVARGLIPFLLTNSWNADQEGDQLVVAQLSGESLASTVDRLMSWVGQTDPPVRLRGRFWSLNAPLDAWKQLAAYLRDEDLQKFRQIALEVLSEVDPLYDMPISERWLAGIQKKRLSRSEVLRRGLANSLVLAAELGDRGELTNVTFRAQSLVDAVIRDLLNEATAERWYSVRDVLPTLAEAGPGEFLEALERDLNSAEPAVLVLFGEETNGVTGFSTDKGYPALLWALERLAWSSRFFTRAALALAELAEKDPGGGLANRPARSLSQIFLGSYRNTEADWSERLSTLDRLTARQPAVGWKLLLSLLPEEGHLVTPSVRPEWRDWGQALDEQVDRYEYWQYVEAISLRVLSIAESSPQYWADLIRALPVLPPAAQEIVFNLVRSASVEEIPEQVLTVLIEIIRALIYNCRRFPGRCLFAEERVTAWEKVLENLESSSFFDKYSWLFESRWVDLPTPEPEDFQAREAEVERLRRVAAKEMFRAEGMEGVIRFAGRVKDPGTVGLAAAEVIRPAPDFEICALLRSGEPAQVGFASQYLFTRSVSEGCNWASVLVENLVASGWPSEDIASACISFRPVRQTWQLAEQLGDDIERSYWQRVGIRSVERFEDLEIVVRKLFTAGRPDRAVQLLWQHHREGIDPDLAVEALERLATEPANTGSGDGQVISYGIKTLFEIVQRMNRSVIRGSSV